MTGMRDDGPDPQDEREAKLLKLYQLADELGEDEYGQRFSITKRETSLNLERVLGKSFPVLDHGFIRVVGYHGDEATIVRAARVSYSKGTKTAREDRGLLRYLIRHRHTSPLEQCNITFHMKLPIFVARQIIRHRTACLASDTQLVFDLPFKVTKNRARIYKMTVGDFFKKWTNGSKTVSVPRTKKGTFEDRVEKNKWYTVAELASVVERNDSNIRALIRSNRLQGDRSVKPMRVLGEWWHDYAQHGQYHDFSVPRRDALGKMLLRSVNETTGEVYHTKVTDIWSNGKKRVYEVLFSDGSKLSATMDHLCFTDKGWLKLEEALRQKARFTGCGKRAREQYDEVAPLSEAELKTEVWRTVVSKGVRWECYEVSNLGRVRSYNRTQSVAASPKLKRQCRVNGYPVVSLSSGGKSVARQVHQLVLEAFSGAPATGDIARHLDGSRANNRLSNLAWGTHKENSEDRMVNGVDQTLTSVWVDVVSVKHRGFEEVFDISVEGPFHNFCAGGVFVHNSLNEMSARYSVLDKEFYVPSEQILLGQGIANKQGSEGEADREIREGFLADLKYIIDDAYTSYTDAMNVASDGVTPLDERKGISRERARMLLPLNAYTQWYWQIDLHNLMHFLSLRMDEHAQWETRQYANIMGDITRQWVPAVWEAFVDYRLKAYTCSRMEMQVLMDLLNSSEVLTSGRFSREHMKDAGMTANEINEFCKRFGIHL